MKACLQQPVFCSREEYLLLEVAKVNNFKRREQSKEIAYLTYLLGTGDAKTFIQQHKLINMHTNNEYLQYL